MRWTIEDTRKWIMWHVGDYVASHGIMEQFRLTGDELCRLTADDFQLKSPDYGKNLHAQLDVWKNGKNVFQIVSENIEQCTVWCFRL